MLTRDDQNVYPPSGAVARRIGARKYFTGRPCLVGHVTPRVAHNGQCMACASDATVANRKKPRAAVVARQAYEERRAKQPELILWYSARTRSRKAGIPFDITADDIKGVWSHDGLCPVLGIRLEHNHKSGSWSWTHPNSPTLDRIIPALGYVKGNICVISQRANAIKSNETDPEAIRRVAAYLENHLNGKT